jgi:glycosyltransferase involved in cell wall biosynthesis
MRVLYFSRGDTAHDRRFLKALAESPHEIFSLRLEIPVRPAAEDAIPGVQYVDWPGLEAPAALDAALALSPALERVIAEIQPDLVHAGPIQLVAALTVRTGFRPLVAMSWGSDLLVEADQSAQWREATLESLRAAGVLVCDNLAVEEKAVRLGFPAEHIVRFPWGVDLAHFSPGPSATLRKWLDWEQNLIILCLRAWEPLYGVDVVARAFVRAAKERPDLRLLLAGDGSQREQIGRILEEGGVSDRAAFPGHLSLQVLPEVYRAADLYVSASHSDGSSVSLMEALACGRPVAVSDIPGNREWVTPGANGWTFADGDDQALAAAILAAANNPANLIRMGEISHKIALEKADWARNFPKLLEAYRQAVHISRKDKGGKQ